MTDRDAEQSDETDDPPDSRLPGHRVERAIRLSYAQAMLSSIYAASTGGMFLIGFALRLGADNVQIGLMSTIPMLCVVVQLASSMLVERGISRRSMTMGAAILNVSGWALVILVPYVLRDLPATAQVTALIAVISLNTLFAHIAGNARASWVGDLIPADRRGTFFGKALMYAGIIGAVFAIVEGTLLDHVKHRGISAFNWLFLFGMFFGMLNVLLFVPQADVPVVRSGPGNRYWAHVRDTFANRPLMIVMAYNLIWSLQAIAGPFYATYLLRDLKMPYLGIGILTGVATVTVLVSSPFWGRIVDRYGSRPVLIACTSAIVPVPLVWIWLTDLTRVYAVIVPINLVMGFAIAGISVALSTLVYKITPSAGRSVQFAIYAVAVVLLASPMPTIGGHLPGWLKSLGIHADLRATFYTTIIFLFAAAWLARRIKEPDSTGTSEMVRNLPNHVRRPASLGDNNE